MDTVKDFGELGARIRQVRLGTGLDQTGLAQRCRLERTALSRIESGERKVSALELARIAEVLQVTLSDLVLLPLADVRAARPPWTRTPGPRSARASGPASISTAHGGTCAGSAMTDCWNRSTWA